MAIERLNVKGCRVPGVKSTFPVMQNFKRNEYDLNHLDKIHQTNSLPDSRNHHFLIRGHPVPANAVFQPQYYSIPQLKTSRPRTTPEMPFTRSSCTRWIEYERNGEIKGPGAVHRKDSDKVKKLLTSNKVNLRLAESVNSVQHRDTKNLTRRRKRFTRTQMRTNVPQGKKSATSLRQCLQVSSGLNASASNIKADDPYKVPPAQFPQRTNREGNVNFNNTNFSRKAKSWIDGIKYQFDSVESYVHFNNVFQNRQNGLVPILKGFPAHCVDTVLIKMLFEMNKYHPYSM
ncbi:hypothetical protein SNE40_005683 [Patella caerulea]|uniref:Uncharacterized protein n=1 Tax=Patella caerulea TaxID=87958 RepID=A0AAN8PXR1_PATCE